MERSIEVVQHGWSKGDKETYRKGCRENEQQIFRRERGYLGIIGRELGEYRKKHLYA